jgi:septum formation protein
MRHSPPIVLASTSRYRRALIAQLGLAVECVPAAYDEEAEKRALGPLSAAELTLHLARGKARSLASTHPDALVIGSDQCVEIDGVILSKPRTAERAVEQLRQLAGRRHHIYTAVCVHHAASERSEAWLDTHTLTMRPLTTAQIEDYVRRDAPLDCAGSYKIESVGVALFESIEGRDYTAVIGLPLMGLVTLLARFGVSIFDEEPRASR